LRRKSGEGEASVLESYRLFQSFVVLLPFFFAIFRWQYLMIPWSTVFLSIIITVVPLLPGVYQSLLQHGIVLQKEFPLFNISPYH